MSPTECGSGSGSGSGSMEFGLRRSPRLAGMNNLETGISSSPLRRTSLRGMGNPKSGSSGSSRFALQRTKFALRRSPRLLAKFASQKSLRLLGMSLTESGSGSMEFGLRRSPRLSGMSNSGTGISLSPLKRTYLRGKSAITIPESRRKSPARGQGMTFCSHDPLDIDTLMRSNREYEAQHFKGMYTYNTDFRAIKTCIHPGGVFAWEDKSSSGISWVAVRGRNSTCVVFKKTLEHVKDRLRSYLRYNSRALTFNFIGLTVISEIEVLADLPDETNQRFECDDHVHKPFAIVSVDPNNINDDHGEIAGKEAAFKYLKDILKKDKIFYRHDAEEAAIHAFQLLCNQKFEPDDIWVASAFMGEHDNLSRADIKSHLEIINTDEYKGQLNGLSKAEVLDNYRSYIKSIIPRYI